MYGQILSNVGRRVEVNVEIANLFDISEFAVYRLIAVNATATSVRCTVRLWLG